MATQSFVSQTTESDSSQAGIFLGNEIAGRFKNAPPHVVIVFCSSRYDYSLLLHAIQDIVKPGLLVGCSSAGEFTTGVLAEGSACAVALSSDHMRFSAGLGEDIGANPEGAARSIAASFKGMHPSNSLFRSALILTDALSGNADGLLEKMNHQMGGTYQFFGGGAGDDVRFQKTHVFFGTKSYTNAAVALEILSETPLGIGVRHDWAEASERMRVTEAEGAVVLSFNGIPALEVYETYATETKQKFDRADPVPFFLHNIIGVDTGHGYKLRVPLAIKEGGGILFASGIPAGSIVKIMSAKASAEDAVKAAAADAIASLQGRTPKLALFFDCVATRLRMGAEFGFELGALKNAL